jgi:hypothetical protein
MDLKNVLPPPPPKGELVQTSELGRMFLVNKKFSDDFHKRIIGFPFGGGLRGRIIP